MNHQLYNLRNLHLIRVQQGILNQNVIYLHILIRIIKINGNIDWKNNNK